MRNFYLLALALLMALSASGQKLKTAVADKYYQDYQFLAAAQAYERIIKTDTRNVAVMEKLVQCYTRLNDPVKSQFWLSKVLKSPQAPVKSFKTFGTLLAANGRYEEASQWFGKSYEQTRDEESLRWLNAYRNLQQLYADSALYQISKVHFNSKYADFSPTFYQEGVVFSSARDNGKVNKMKFEYNNTWFIDLYFVKDTLAKPVPFSDVLNSKYHEGPLSFTPDQKTVYFTRNNHLKKSFFSSDGVSKLKIYYATVYNGRWGQIREFNLNNKEYSVGQPALASDKLMYFVSDMPGGFGGTDLYRTEKVNDVWQKPVNLGPEINTSGNEMFPFVGEGDMLYFASNGHPGLGGLDVFYTAVSGTDFSPVSNLGYPVNTTHDDFGFIIRNNQGYFSSNRDSKTTNDDIYRFKVSQSHPVMVVAREKTAPTATDSLSVKQGNEIVLAQEKEAEPNDATKPGNSSSEPTQPGALAAAGVKAGEPEAALASGPEAGQVPGALKKGEEELLAASPAGNASKEGFPHTAGNGSSGQQDQLTGEQHKAATPGIDNLSTSLQTAQANADKADPEEVNRNTFGLNEESGRPATAAADPWKGIDPFFPAASRQDSTSRQPIAAAQNLPAGSTNEENSAASSGILPAGIAGAPGMNPGGQEKAPAAKSLDAKPADDVTLAAAFDKTSNPMSDLTAADKTQGPSSDTSSQADSLATLGNAGTPDLMPGDLLARSSAGQDVSSPAGAQDKQADGLAGNTSGLHPETEAITAQGDKGEDFAARRAQEDRDPATVAATRENQSFSGISSGEKDANAQKNLAFQDPKQDGSGTQNLVDQSREAGPARFLAGTGSQPAGEEAAAQRPGGRRAGEAEEGIAAGEGSLPASGKQEQDADHRNAVERVSSEEGQAGVQPGAVKRVKALPKEFKTGSVGEVIELEILYDLDKTTIRPDAAHVLNGLVTYMKKNPNVKVELGAHTDVRGSDNYNERLSQGRAESVVDYLARHGISRSRLVAVGFGEKDLALAAAANEAEHQVNRRTTAKIFANEALLMAYHENVTQPKLAAIRAQKQEKQASRLAASFPLFPDNLPANEETSASGAQPASLALESGLRQEPLPGEGRAIPVSPEAYAPLAAAGTGKTKPRTTSLQAAAEDGVSFEEESPVAVPVTVYTREMLFWNPNATDPKAAAAQAKKNPDTFFIISNAFLSLVEAEWYMQEVLDLGGEGRIIMPFAGSKLYRVAVAGYNKYSEAERQLPAKKQVFGAHSWILGLNSKEFALRRMLPEAAAPQALAVTAATPPARPSAVVVPAAAEVSSLLASANALISTLERRIEGLESRLAAAEAGTVRTVKAAVHAPKVLYDKVVEANRHRASARLWAEVAPYTIDQKTGRAYIVSGSFSTLGSANWYRKKMARMGAGAKIILPNATNRLYVVTVADYTSRNEARQKLLSLKKTFGLYIWILDY